MRLSSKKVIKKDQVQFAQALPDPVMLVEEAQLRAQEMIAQAQAQAQALLAQAQKEAEALKAKAKEEGKKEGVAAGQTQGKEEARKKALADVSGACGALAKAAKALEAERASFWAEADPVLTKMSLALVERVLRRAQEEDRDLVKRVVKEAVRELGRVESLELRVHPQDLEAAGELPKELSDLCPQIKEVKVLADPEVGRGGVKLRTDYGRIDARWSSQWERLLDSMGEAEE